MLKRFSWLQKKACLNEESLGKVILILGCSIPEQLNDFRSSQWFEYCQVPKRPSAQRQIGICSSSCLRELNFLNREIQMRIFL